MTSLLQYDNFKSDWYGWVTNQLAHFAVGLVLYVACTAAWFWAAGELPYRGVLLAVIAFGYLLFEFAIQRGSNIFDSIEDFVFVVIYGAGPIALVSNEVMLGSSVIYIDVMEIKPLVLLLCVHCFFGVVFRLKRTRS